MSQCLLCPGYDDKDASVTMRNRHSIGHNVQTCTEFIFNFHSWNKTDVHRTHTMHMYIELVHCTVQIHVSMPYIHVHVYCTCIHEG